LPPVYFEELGSEAFGLDPIGTGPFMLTEWVRDSHLTLTRNDDYWRGPHPISQVVFRVIPEPVARLAACETGEVDLAMYLTTDAITRLEGHDTAQAVVAAGLRKYATHFDTDGSDGALDDPLVRTALNHAVDKQALAETVFRGTADVLQGQWQVSTEPGFNPNISEFEYDPERARELIAEAGYADGFDLMLSYTAGNTPLEQELGEIVASYMEQVGVRVEQRYMEYGAFLNVRGEGTLGTHQWGLLLPPEPHFNYALFVQGSLYQWHYLGERYDELVDMGSKTTDPAEREEIYHECAQIMHDDPPMLYLVVPRDIYGVNSRVTGFEPRIDQVLWLFDVDMA
jgi:peptide/nickel transport system substrate-binding protein